MARKRDAIDLACEQWATVQRELLGVSEPRLASDFLGAVRCTLGQRRDLHAGARSPGLVAQHWPEVHRGPGLSVARAVQHMPLSLREICLVHYVVPGSTKIKIDRLGIGRRLYWDRLGRAKMYIDGWLAARDDMDQDCA